MRFSSSLKVSIALTFVAVLSLCLTILFSASSTTRAAGASITLSLKAGPPTSVTKVSGTGFGTSEKVNINFDTALVGSATTNTTGAFSATVKVPSTALPGTHTVHATGQT